MKKARWTLAALFLAAASSCIIPIYMDEGTRFDGSGPAFLRTVPFAAGGALRIDNAFGNIIVRGWDRDEVEIAAEETWDESAGASIRQDNIVPRIDVETGDKTITIRARPRDEEFAGDRIVHLVVQAPHHAVLKSVSGRRGRISLSDMYGEAVLRLEEGEIRVENFSGSLDAELNRGSIQAELIDLRIEDAVRLVLGEGPVTVLLEPAFNGRLEADAPSGAIACDFTLEPPVEKKKASGKIGSGEGALVTVSARTGSITIR